jgi:hypothetical protein
MNKLDGFLEFGIVGLIAFLAISGMIYFYLKIERIRAENILKAEKENEYKISLLEKTLTALTAIEMAWLTHKTEFSKEVSSVIEKIHKPLIDEVKEALKEVKR